MGWDAHSSAALAHRPLRIKHPELREAFKNAHLEVIKKAGAVDGDLHLGGLDVSTCRIMLERATGQSCYVDWSKEQVQEFSEKAVWDFDVEEDELWAYESAKVFLELCARYKLSIRFSY